MVCRPKGDAHDEERASDANRENRPKRRSSPHRHGGSRHHHVYPSVRNTPFTEMRREAVHIHQFGLARKHELPAPVEADNKRSGHRRKPPMVARSPLTLEIRVMGLGDCCRRGGRTTIEMPRGGVYSPRRRTSRRHPGLNQFLTRAGPTPGPRRRSRGRACSAGQGPEDPECGGIESLVIEAVVVPLTATNVREGRGAATRRTARLTASESGVLLASERRASRLFIRITKSSIGNREVQERRASARLEPEPPREGGRARRESILRRPAAPRRRTRRSQARSTGRCRGERGPPGGRRG